MSTGEIDDFVGKQVRSFNIEHEIGKAIDREAEMVGPNKASQVVNELLKEALAHRQEVRARFEKVALDAAEGASLLTSVLLVLWAVLVAFL